MKRYFLPVLIIFVIIFASCYYDNEEALYPVYSNTCDTTNVTFSVTITSILNNSCLSCHSNARAAALGNNIPLENYGDVVAKITNVIGSIKHTGKYSQMPKNSGSLKPCSITQFDIWVRKEMPI
jgi:hypothetical protein